MAGHGHDPGAAGVFEASKTSYTRLRRLHLFVNFASSKWIVVPALTDLADSTRPPRTGPRPLTLAWRNYETELQNLLNAN